MAENKRYTTQQKTNSGQTAVIKDDLYLLSIASGSDNDYILTYNPQSKQVSYLTSISSSGGGGSTNTGSLLLNASFSNPNLTFTRGNGTTFDVSLLTLVPTSASYALSSSQATSASFSISSSRAVSASFATSASYAFQATSASFAISASRTVSASFADSASQAISASFAISASRAISASFATSASYAFQATSASFAISASQAVSASFATSASRAVSASFATSASYAFQATSASFAISSSQATSASFVTTLNQNVIITGSAVIGSSSLGANENTLTLGPSPAGGAGEGGQLGLNAVGGTYTSASFIDNWQNQFRILRGTNAGSDGQHLGINLHSGQVTFNRYSGSGAFPGTAAATLGVDSSGNIITTTPGGASLTGGATNYIARWASPTSLTTGSIYDNGTNVSIGNISPSYKLDVTGDIRATGAIYANANGALYFQGGDDVALYDINVTNTLGVYGVQDSTVGSIKLGSGGGTISGKGGLIGIGTITPSLGTLEVNGNVYATSFTGSLLGTASFANNATSASSAISASRAVSASFATSASYAFQATSASFANTAQTSATASYVLQAVSASFATSASQAVSASFTISASRAISSSFAISASYAFQATSASFAISSSQATSASFTISASRAVSASRADTASFVAAPGSSTQVVFNSGGVFGADSGFVYTSGRVGIGESSPSARLEIRGSGATSATTAFRVENSSATTSMVVLDDGDVGVGTASPGFKLTVDTTNAVDGIALNGTNNFGYIIQASGVTKGYIPAYPTTPGAFSTDSLVGDLVYRIETESSQRFLFNTNAGAGGSTLAITGSRVGINTATPTLGNLTVNGNVWANSYTGSLFGTASWANNSVTASYLLNFPVNPNLYATQNNNLDVVSANTAYSMSFDTLVTSDQLNLVSGSRLEVTSAGKYTIQFSANILQTTSSPTEVYIWLSRSGTDLADTNRQITMDGAGNNFTVAAWNWIVDSGDSEYYEIRYGASDTNIQLNYQSTPSIGPEIPAAIVSMFKIN
jgi:hypothetical protein